METWNISAKFTNDKLKSGDIIDKIDVFEDQIDSWVLLHANALCDDKYNFRQQSGFAVLMLVSTYFEAMESFYAGIESKGKSKEFSRKGFLRVFSELPEILKQKRYQTPQNLAEEIANEVYEQLRCGLFHEATTKSKVMIREDTAAVGFMVEDMTNNLGSIVIDSIKFLARVENHFHEYIGELRNPNEILLRQNFEKLFDLKMSRSRPVMPPPGQN